MLSRRAWRDGSGDDHRPAVPRTRRVIGAGVMTEVVDDDERRRAVVMRWRRTERQRLIDARLALPSPERQAHSALIARHLDEMLGDVSGLTVAAYWPFRGEPNLRSWMERIHARGARCALPVVIERRAPLVFRAWRPGAGMVGGIWDIPVPADGCEVTPDVVLAPVVGFDAAGYRLGYGGGFYDRTLASMARRPRVIGVGLALAAIATIHPLAHDIPMQVIVTEGGTDERAPMTSMSGSPEGGP